VAVAVAVAVAAECDMQWQAVGSEAAYKS